MKTRPRDVERVLELSLHALDAPATKRAAALTRKLAVVVRLSVVAGQLFAGINHSQRVEFHAPTAETHEGVGRARVIDVSEAVFGA